ncbi:MAG: tetratricopeptide repeat protein [Aquificaceae bacterium]|nr:tetratricopeptide repeat protein [Aquificaceae bacterium]MCX8060847.1 tetratricopeptide repeat protein [Aquificaceae bacterium]MDW8096670.1 tetratricopeptide repeat protein [Aquificaceae bacterium]
MKGVLLAVLAVMSSASCVSVVVLKDPLSAQERIDLGYLYEKEGKLELAKKEYAKAIRKDRRSWLAYYNLGNVYARRGDMQKAQELYQRALRIERDPDLLNNLAFVLKERGQYCQALELLEEALKKRQRVEYTQNLREVERLIANRNLDCSSLEGEGEPW